MLGISMRTVQLKSLVENTIVNFVSDLMGGRPKLFTIVVRVKTW